MEIGSFIELDLRNTGEFHHGNNITRLNIARAGILHACRLYNVTKIFVPYYQCPTVSAFLKKNGIEVFYYHIDKNFQPVVDANTLDSAFLIVNYFGILANNYISEIANKYCNVILDYSPSFYSEPLKSCISVYSARKFFGVPDGCYVISNEFADNEIDYDQDESSEFAAFLLKRIEKGSSPVYAERMKNEDRLDKAGILKMSCLTQKLLANIDYASIAKKRKENFVLAHDFFSSINKIDPTTFIDEGCVPMVYPLVLENEELVKKLSEKKIYTGRWWHYLINFLSPDKFEVYLSKYMIPIPIDQRYSYSELKYVSEVIHNLYSH